MGHDRGTRRLRRQGVQEALAQFGGRGLVAVGEEPGPGVLVRRRRQRPRHRPSQRLLQGGGSVLGPFLARPATVRLGVPFADHGQRLGGRQAAQQHGQLGDARTVRRPAECAQAEPVEGEHVGGPLDNQHRTGAVGPAPGHGQPAAAAGRRQLAAVAVAAQQPHGTQLAVALGEGPAVRGAVVTDSGQAIEGLDRQPEALGQLLPQDRAAQVGAALGLALPVHGRRRRWRQWQRPVAGKSVHVPARVPGGGTEVGEARLLAALVVAEQQAVAAVTAAARPAADHTREFPTDAAQGGL
jgi:hypothetical protein